MAELKTMPAGDLTLMLGAQWSLQAQTYGVDPTTLAGDELAEYIRYNAFALFKEVYEAFDHAGWKPWATSRHLDGEAFLRELVDAWHFLMNLMLAGAGGMRDQHGQPRITNAQELAAWFIEAYMDKREENAQRQVDGYTGIKEAE